ncbi:hypothetical protein DPSP01_006664 [Paraphaeosphaeria sporulosa]
MLKIVRAVVSVTSGGLTAWSGSKLNVAKLDIRCYMISIHGTACTGFSVSYNSTVLLFSGREAEDRDVSRFALYVKINRNSFCAPNPASSQSVVVSQSKLRMQAENASYLTCRSNDQCSRHAILTNSHPPTP